MPGLNPRAAAFALGSSTPEQSTPTQQPTLDPLAATFTFRPSPGTDVSGSNLMTDSNRAQPWYTEIKNNNGSSTFLMTGNINNSFPTSYGPINHGSINRQTPFAEPTGMAQAAPMAVSAADLLKAICLSQEELALVFENGSGLNFKSGPVFICEKIAAAYRAKVQGSPVWSTCLGCHGIGGAVARWLNGKPMRRFPPVDFSQSTQMGETVAMLFRSDPQFSSRGIPPEEQELLMDDVEDGAAQYIESWSSETAEADEELDLSQYLFSTPTTAFSEEGDEPLSLSALVKTSDPLYDIHDGFGNYLRTTSEWEPALPVEVQGLDCAHCELTRSPFLAAVLSLPCFDAAATRCECYKVDRPPRIQPTRRPLPRPIGFERLSNEHERWRPY